jgi:hypothetical protein
MIMKWAMPQNSKVSSINSSKTSNHSTSNCMHMFVDVCARSIPVGSTVRVLFLRISLVSPFESLSLNDLADDRLGNMWAQMWNDRYNDFEPYPNAPLINMTQLLKEKNYTIHQMYQTAEQFFTSIGLYPMTPKFWSRSVFEKPDDHDIVCHAAAYDFNYHDDYRVRICTQLTDDYFYTVHHEMGHVEYYMAYAEAQPTFYQAGANSAFHEAIGDTIGMFASKFVSFSR